MYGTAAPLHLCPLSAWAFLFASAAAAAVLRQPENVFLTNSSAGDVDWEGVRLGDFGSAVEVALGGTLSGMHTRCGAEPYYFFFNIISRFAFASLQPPPPAGENVVKIEAKGDVFPRNLSCTKKIRPRTVRRAGPWPDLSPCFCKGRPSNVGSLSFFSIRPYAVLVLARRISSTRQYVVFTPAW